MIVRRALLVFCLALFPVAAFAVVGADMGITAADSPDPVAPDGNITYTVHVTNAGPGSATTAHLNVVNNGTLLFQSMVMPAGWSCTATPVGFGGSFTCTAATLSSSSNDTFTIVMNAGKAQFGINNTTINQLFGVNASESDPNSGNNNVTVSTSYVAPHVDMQTTATDSPDPVFPDGNITYTVTVTNAGPDTATNAHMSAVLNGTLLFQSITVPSGWTCPALSAGFGGSFTCTATTFAASATSTFTVVLNAGQAQFGVTNQTINQLFGATNDWVDTNNANNNVTVSTSYVAPHVDMQTTATDSPDPVFPDGNITYTVTVTNAGPDAARNAHLSATLNNTLRFQSISIPSGWTCPALVVGQGTSFTCTAATFAASATSVFTVVLNAAQAQFGVISQTINQLFGASNDWVDNNNANNNVTVSTSYVVPAANLAVTNSDAPDPVATGATITYTQTLTNNGPDAAANAHITESIGSGVTFQSISAPAGFSCTTPAVGGTGTINCTIASMANGATASFTVVVNVTAASGSITNTVSGSSDAVDSVSSNNSATAITAILAPQSADLGVTKTTPSTSALPGAAVTYTIVVTNHGPDTATSVSMTDPLPAKLLFQSITSPAGFSCTTPSAGATGTITCTAASLANGATATFTVVTIVAPGATGSIVNGAGVSSATSDPISGNGSVNAGSVAAPAASDVPALSSWTLMLLAAMLALGALMRTR